MDWPGYVKVASGRSLSWGKVSCMGDWVRAFVGIFSLVFFFFSSTITRLVDGLTYSFPFSLFQLSIFLFLFFPIVHVRYIIMWVLSLFCLFWFKGMVGAQSKSEIV